MTSVMWTLRRKGWHPKRRRLARLRALYWVVIRRHETEICGRCGGPVRLIFNVPTDFWMRFCGTNQPPHGVLCPSCFTELVIEGGGPTPYWMCGEGEFPTCDGSPCVHEQSMMEVGEQREDYWNALLLATGDRDEAVALLDRVRALD